MRLGNGCAVFISCNTFWSSNSWENSLMTQEIPRPALAKSNNKLWAPSSIVGFNNSPLFAK